MHNSKSFFLKLIIVLGFIASFFVSWSVYKEFKKKKAVQEEIEKLQKEAEKISKENFNISQKIEYLESQDYKKREAKEKMNLRDPNENVVVIKPSPSQKSEPKKEEPKKIVTVFETKNKSNPEKWWEYFFSYKK